VHKTYDRTTLFVKYTHEITLPYIGVPAVGLDEVCRKWKNVRDWSCCQDWHESLLQNAKTEGVDRLQLYAG